MDRDKSESSKDRREEADWETFERLRSNDKSIPARRRELPIWKEVKK